MQNIAQQISVIIQGPLDDRTYEAINAYDYFGETIVSTWEGQDIGRFLVNVKKRENLKIVTNKYPDQNYFNEGGRFFQAQTTYAGCLFSGCKYVMKTRSDELYPDLYQMLKNLEKYPDRSHTTNNGFWKHHPYCYSNHLFIDQTHLVKEAMIRMINSCLGNTDIIDIKTIYCAESAFGYFLMNARGFDLNKEDWKSVFRNNVFITPCDQLKGHLHSGASIHHRGGFKRSSAPYPEGRLEAPGHKHNKGMLYYDYQEF